VSAVGRWEILDSRWAFRGGFLGLRVDHCRLPDGRRSPDYYFLELPDAAIVVAITPDEHVVLSREYKHGARDVHATLPAGFIEPGEAPEAAARRELAEETGYSAPAFEPLGAFHVLPSLSSMTVHAFLARGVVPAGEPHTDPFEEISVEAVPLAEIVREHRGGPRRYLHDVPSVLAVGLALDRLYPGRAPGGGSG
jgi:8-oxo-dGTP pyrophosphatase MutT (NUDIX family)